ncbi:ComEC/Rec2 family competence protein [Sinomicrobium soli]|uniref:ComEC/Rec2 family competence protein n=1 Tax=Sinomicrobium sp. N-1-3-6 TaxID=2219864 RepID=UPI000DCB92D7|nr:ComEC/Rec2 family competence protein [Sinomicrobium sp. N-1-3-6]RAV29751.1 hypothetical protein DN748_06450 [Sinomicrobium sp. N-1-3-6]
MLPWDYNSFRLLLPFCTGIAVGLTCNIPPGILLSCSLVLLLLLGISHYLTPVSGRTVNYSFMATAFILLWCVGLYRINSEKPRYIPDHYSHFIRGSDTLVITPLHRLKPTSRNLRYTVRVDRINGKPAGGKVICHISRESVPVVMSTGHSYSVKGNLRNIRPPRNPHQFNYRNYLHRQFIYHQLYLEASGIQVLPAGKNNIYAIAGKLRNDATRLLQKNGFEGDALAVMQALLLGERQDIPDALYNDYAAAGAIHILAVSGLHVGILLFLLHYALFPFDYIRYGRIPKFIITVSALWLFACIAGLSPSVVRATTMFTFLAFSVQLRRTPEVRNTLFVSMFVLLLIKPDFLSDTGFQLSYAAVFSIVYFHPVLMSVRNPSNPILRYFWQLAGVSVTAQLGVLPLSLYYFHRFPALFLLTNIVVVPLTGIIMSAGVLILILALTGLLPPVFVQACTFLIARMNAFISLAGRQESLVFDDIFFSAELLVISYIFTGSLLLLFSGPTRKARLLVWASAGLLAGIPGYRHLHPAEKEEFIIWHQYRQTFITRQSGSRVAVYRAENDTVPLKRMLGGFPREEGISRINVHNLLPGYDFGDQFVLYVNRSDIEHYLSAPKADYILLSQSPRINLERLIQYHMPKAVIADGNNAPYLVALWKSTCDKKGLPFHNTYEKGAYVLSP